MITNEAPVNFRLYMLLAVIAVVPIWSAHYFPTVDGPSHLYNSWLLQQLLNGNHLVTQWYAIDWRPNPNWTGHIVLALLVSILPPPIAEKILVTGLVLLFAAPMWLSPGLPANTPPPSTILALPSPFP